jgi:glycosyltransferase involved in cell wall biosynthesis
MDRYFVNKAGTMYIFPELNNKRIEAKNRIYPFTEEEINKSKFLRDLIKNGQFVEVNQEDYDNQDLNNLSENQPIKTANIQTKKETSNFMSSIKVLTPGQNKEETLSIPLGNPVNDVSLDPSKVTSIGYGKDIQKKNVIEQKTEFIKEANKNINISDFASIINEKKNPNPINKIKEVWWCGPVPDAGGYGKMNREAVNRLYKRGWNVGLQLFDGLPDTRSLLKATPEIKEMLDTKVTEKAPSVWGIMPPRYLHRNGKKILFTMMETGELPESFAEKCNNADEIWLPSKFNMDVFSRANLKAELHYVPLGVDVNLYRPIILTSEQKSIFNIKTKGFVFLSLFGWSLRKGVDVLFESYLKAFTEHDDVTLLVVSRKDGSSSHEKQNEIRNQIIDYIKKWCPSNNPHVIHIGEAMPEEHLPILYNMADAFVLPSRGEGFCLPMCFVEGTLVDMSDGVPKEINTLNKGEIALSGTGKNTNIIETFKRKYNGEIISLKASGCYENKVTPEHPFLSVKRKSRYDIGKDLSNRIEEIDAKNLVKGDFLVYPIRSNGKEDLENIDLEKYGIHSSKYSNKGKNALFSWRKLSLLINETPIMISRAVLNKTNITKENKEKILKKLSDINFEYNKESYIIPKEICLNDDLLEFFGYYISEGSMNNNHQVMLSSHISEKNVHDLEKRIIENTFKRHASENQRGNSYCISFYLPNGKNLFSKFGLSAESKIIPDFLMKYSAIKLIPLLRGIFIGDGHFRKDLVRLSSNSKKMLLQVRNLLLELNIRCTINDCGKNRKNQYYLAIYNDLERFYSLFDINIPSNKNIKSGNKKNLNKSWIINGYFYMTINKIVQDDFDGYVYNIDTDGESTYIANGASNHNCEAGACEKPVIASRCGGQLDFLNDDNSYLIDIEGYEIGCQEIRCLSSYYEKSPFAVLGDKAVDQMIDRMRHIVNNYSEAKNKGILLRKNIINNFTWDQMVDKIEERLNG